MQYRYGAANPMTSPCILLNAVHYHFQTDVVAYYVVVVAAVVVAAAAAAAAAATVAAELSDIVHTIRVIIVERAHASYR